MKSNLPNNYLQPAELEPGPKVIEVGRTHYRAPAGSKIHRSTNAGRPIVHVLVPSGQIHQLHEGGERPLTPQQVAAIKAKHFAS